MKRLVNDFRAVRFFAAAVLALVALFVLAACGGGDSTDSSSSEGTNASAPAITKAVLIKKADAICIDTDEVQRRAFDAYQNKNGGVVLGDTPEMRKIMKELLLPPIGVELEEISALGMPTTNAAEFTAILRGWERALESSLKNPGLVLRTGEGAFKKPDERAKKYGFKSCSQVV